MSETDLIATIETKMNIGSTVSGAPIVLEAFQLPDSIACLVAYTDKGKPFRLCKLTEESLKRQQWAHEMNLSGKDQSSLESAYRQFKAYVEKLMRKAAT